MTTARPAPAAAFSAAVAWASEWTTMTGSRDGPDLVEPAEIGGYLDHAVGETPFVVVPGEDPDKALVEHLRLGHVEGRAVRVVVEVDRDGRRLVDAEDAAQPVRTGRLLHQRVDLVAGGLARGIKCEVDERDVGGRHADRGAVELAFQGRQYEADRPRCAGRGWDHRLRGSASAAEIAVQRVLQALVAGVGVDRRHEAALDADALMQYIRDWRETVGRARAVGDDFVIGLQLLLVDPQHHRHVGAIGRGRDDDALGARLQMLRGGVARRKKAGAFERHINAELAPRKLCRVPFGGDADFATADIHPVVAGRDLAGEAAVHTVVSEEMGISLDWAE